MGRRFVRNRFMGRQGLLGRSCGRCGGREPIRSTEHAARQQNVQFRTVTEGRCMEANVMILATGAAVSAAFSVLRPFLALASDRQSQRFWPPCPSSARSFIVWTSWLRKRPLLQTASIRIPLTKRPSHRQAHGAAGGDNAIWI